MTLKSCLGGVRQKIFKKIFFSYFWPKMIFNMIFGLFSHILVCQIWQKILNKIFFFVIKWVFLFVSVSLWVFRLIEGSLMGWKCKNVSTFKQYVSTIRNKHVARSNKSVVKFVNQICYFIIINKSSVVFQLIRSCVVFGYLFCWGSS